MFKSFIVLILSGACVGGPVTINIHPLVEATVQPEEPSDIHFYDGHFYMVSDKGFLYETDAKGTILKKSSFIGSDFEGVYRRGDKIYVTAERLRQVHHDG